MQYELVIGYIVLVVVVITAYFVHKYWKQFGKSLLMGVYVVFLFWLFWWITTSLGGIYFEKSKTKNNNFTPTYDRTGEVMNDDEYYERSYEEYQADQAAEAHSALCEPCFDKYYCNQMSSCDEAYYCLNDCGMTRLDGDLDGVPCEIICETQ